MHSPIRGLRSISERVFKRARASLIYETGVGIKCLNQPVRSEDFPGLAREQVETHAPELLLLGCDGLKDDLSLLGLPVARSPHSELMRLLERGAPIAGSDYVRRLASGALDMRPARSAGAGALASLRRSFLRARALIASGSYPPIMIMRVGGSTYIADGKHRAALCAALGLPVRCRDASAVATDPFFWRISDRMRRAPASYGRHLAYFDALAEDARRAGTYASRAEILRDLRERPIEKTGHVYHPIPFPEFEGLACSSDPRESRAKLAAIRAALEAFHGRLRGLRVLDIGANAGYYAFSLAQAGAEVTAFEPHPRYAPIGRFLAAESGLKVRWRDAACAPELIAGERYDAALMTSVFQWAAEGGARLESARRLLRAAAEASPCLLFELGYNRGASCLKTARWNHYGEVVGLLAESTPFRRFKLLRATRPWRLQTRYLILCSNDPRFDDGPLRRAARAVAL